MTNGASATCGPPANGIYPVGDETPTIAIDTREQRPYWFPRSVVKTLATGDYSLVGLEDRVTVERKSKSDAFNSLGRSRPRFYREVERLQHYDYAAIVVESSLPDFMTPPPFSRMCPQACIHTLVAWSVRYGVHVFFAGDRAHGNALTSSILHKFWRHYSERSNAG
jgi:ERCC4-type nuclease